ncbi:hypothetical protein BX070DRAFT_250006 [Coemansia spiralis]|nr:hypothetical protein BX070DRAFT_250006 [Coemansia spiralis]
MLLFESRLLSGAATAFVVALAYGSQPVSAKWAFTQQPAAERARACQEQVSFCYNACGSVANTDVNFCNIQTTGWNCACSSGAGDRNVRHYEWPISASECRAALATCNDGCSAHTNTNERVTCFTSCATDYQCNTIEAPMSSLRVNGAYDKPSGYIPPVDDKEIELTIGMKFDGAASGQDGSNSHKAHRVSDPGVLPKSIPRLNNADNADDYSGANKANGNNRKNPSARPNSKYKGGSGQRDGSGAAMPVSSASQTLLQLPRTQLLIVVFLNVLVVVAASVSFL